MYKIKPTLIDSYRVYKYEIFEKSLEDILKQIRGEYEPKEAMQLGTEIHRYFETGTADLMPEELQQLEGISAQIQPGINEVSILHTIEGITFDIRVDRLSGLLLHEFKTGSHFHGVDFYDSSIQWKVYLLATGAEEMVYHIITYNSVRPYKFKYHTPFSFYPYKNMEKEVMELAYEFIDFCRNHNVENYIRI
jgi:hypothetical protein